MIARRARAYPNPRLALPLCKTRNTASAARVCQTRGQPCGPVCLRAHLVVALPCKPLRIAAGLRLDLHPQTRRRERDSFCQEFQARRHHPTGTTSRTASSHWPSRNKRPGRPGAASNHATAPRIAIRRETAGTESPAATVSPTAAIVPQSRSAPDRPGRVAGRGCQSAGWHKSSDAVQFAAESAITEPDESAIRSRPDSGFPCGGGVRPWNH